MVSNLSSNTGRDWEGEIHCRSGAVYIKRVRSHFQFVAISKGQLSRTNFRYSTIRYHIGDFPELFNFQKKSSRSGTWSVVDSDQCAACNHRPRGDRTDRLPIQHWQWLPLDSRSHRLIPRRIDASLGHIAVDKPRLSWANPTDSLAAQWLSSNQTAASMAVLPAPTTQYWLNPAARFGSWFGATQVTSLSTR